MLVASCGAKGKGFAVKALSPPLSDIVNLDSFLLQDYFLISNMGIQMTLQSRSVVRITFEHLEEARKRLAHDEYSNATFHLLLPLQVNLETKFFSPKWRSLYGTNWSNLFYHFSNLAPMAESVFNYNCVLSSIII